MIRIWCEMMVYLTLEIQSATCDVAKHRKVLKKQQINLSVCSVLQVFRCRHPCCNITQVHPLCVSCLSTSIAVVRAARKMHGPLTLWDTLPGPITIPLSPVLLSWWGAKTFHAKGLCTMMCRKPCRSNPMQDHLWLGGCRILPALPSSGCVSLDHVRTLCCRRFLQLGLFHVIRREYWPR